MKKIRVYDLPNGQVVEILTLKEVATMIKDYKCARANGFESEDCGVYVMYKDGVFSDCPNKISNISAAEWWNPETIAVYGKFMLGDVDTGEEFTLEEAMKRQNCNVLYVAVLY